MKLENIDKMTRYEKRTNECEKGGVVSKRGKMISKQEKDDVQNSPEYRKLGDVYKSQPYRIPWVCIGGLSGSRESDRPPYTTRWGPTGRPLGTVPYTQLTLPTKRTVAIPVRGGPLLSTFKTHRFPLSRAPLTHLSY